MNTHPSALALALAITTLGCARSNAVDSTTASATGSSDTGEELGCGPESATGLSAGMCAPNFAMPDRDGVEHTLLAQRGKVALVDISAIW